MSANRIALNRSLALIASLVVLAIVSVSAAESQTFTVLHNFTGGPDGAYPQSGLTIDAAGNLYGTTPTGGAGLCGYNGAVGCGVIYKMQRHGSAWTFSPLYRFRGSLSDGAFPEARVVFGPNGSLYGTADSNPAIIYNLRPPVHFCGSFSCPWSLTVLYQFPEAGVSPYVSPGDLTFDHAGNIYGTTVHGGPGATGTVYELSGSVLTDIHTFVFGQLPDGWLPYSGVIYGPDGSLYGTTSQGGNNDPCGITYRLVLSGSSWGEEVLHSFGLSGDGCHPIGGVILATGGLYGTTMSGGGVQDDGTVFAPGWQYSFTVAGQRDGGPRASLFADAAGNVYGTTYSNGVSFSGSVFELTPQGNYISLHDFSGRSDGLHPISNVVMDSSGNLYGTTSQGGAYGYGVVWEITP